MEFHYTETLREWLRASEWLYYYLSEAGGGLDDPVRESCLDVGVRRKEREEEEGRKGELQYHQ